MRSGLGLCVLGLLCLHSSDSLQVYYEPSTVSLEHHINLLLLCDDPSVEAPVSSALHAYNGRLRSGHKLALFQILGASRRPFTCKATVYVTDTASDTQQVDCFLDGYIAPEKASCLGCPEAIDENSEDLKVPLSASISKYNANSNSTHLFTLNSVGKATRQVIAGFRFKVTFDMRKSTCAKAEHTDLNELCVPNDQDVILNRRRPAGWSPLRHILYERPYASPPPPTLPPPPPPPAPQSPSKASAKEESSEEDTTTEAPRPSASPDVSMTARYADAVGVHPLHCPSKPWKPFGAPVQPGAATEAPPEADSSQPTAGFRDTDMLA
ncbi:hypothetical protein F2P81_005338 [Scophthalmus maximus]|uniref:Cystatin domain-containing protein n=1 Tax=Scophthalmus maximus TaxID=52904 RepID=A0A6A4T2V4_SCOMX|nr:hypothetical protein F2P81_005338 [Scophthalmus maximus]